jgi:prepilin-type N-terminal cleavage/methylation domain-containing protein
MHNCTAVRFRTTPRQAFTLIELMLVLAIVVVIGGLSWPTLKHSFELARLKSGAEQVQSAFGHARVDAMNKGVPQVFHFDSGTGQYSVDAWQDDMAAVDDDASTSSSSSSTAATASASPSAATADGSTPDPAKRQLPDGIVFSNGDRVLDARAEAVESELSSSAGSAGSGSSSPPIMFYPDGTASEASVTVTSPSGQSISIILRAFTGVSRMSAVFVNSQSGGTTP